MERKKTVVEQFDKSILIGEAKVSIDSGETILERIKDANKEIPNMLKEKLPANLMDNMKAELDYDKPIQTTIQKDKEGNVDKSALFSFELKNKYQDNNSDMNNK